MKLTKNNDKEIYRVWWEYLKLNALYKEYCDWRRKGNRDISKIPKKFILKNINVNGLIPIAIIEGKSVFFNPILAYYPFVLCPSDFGDIYKRDFEKWWEVKENHRIDKISFRKTIENFAESIGNRMDEAIESFKYHEGREPNLKELKKYFLDNLALDESERLLISVKVVGEDTNHLVEEFKKAIKEKRKYPTVKKGEQHNSRIQKPYFNTTSKARYLRLDEIKRYLEVYDLKQQGFALSAIIRKIEPSKDYKDTNIQRAYRLDLQRAKNIMKNVEEGIFPGDYQP